MASAHSLGSAQAVPWGAPQVLAVPLHRPETQALLLPAGQVLWTPSAGSAAPAASLAAQWNVPPSQNDVPAQSASAAQPPLSAGMHSLLCGPQVPLWQTWAALAGVQAPLPETFPHFLLAPQMLSAQVRASVQAPPSGPPQVLVVALQGPLAQTAVALAWLQLPSCRPSPAGMAVPLPSFALHIRLGRSQ